MAEVQPSTFSARDILNKFYNAEKVYTESPPERRDFSTIATLFADDFIMEQSSALPWAGTYHGPAGLKEWIEKAAEWVVIDVQGRQIYENETVKERIVVLSTIFYSCHKTGERLDFPLSQTIDFDLGHGTIKQIRSYYWDIARLNRAMGYSSA